MTDTISRQLQNDSASNSLKIESDFCTIKLHSVMCTGYKYCSAHSFALREKKWRQICWSALYFSSSSTNPHIFLTSPIKEPRLQSYTQYAFLHFIRPNRLTSWLKCRPASYGGSLSVMRSYPPYAPVLPVRGVWKFLWSFSCSPFKWTGLQRCCAKL